MTEMTEAYAIEISGWRYGAGYEIYDLPAWDEMVADGWALADAEKRKRFRAFVTREEGLVAFTQHSVEPDGIMLGVGANPACLSMGYGSQAIRQAVAELTEKYPESRIFLEARTWNERAVRSYQKAGFVVESTVQQVTHVGPGTFYRMVYKK